MTIRENTANSLAWLRENMDPDGGETFTWNAAEIPCVSDTAMHGLELGPGGKSWTVQLTLRVDRTNFLTADSSLITVDSDLYTVDNAGRHPVAGRSLTFRGKTYRIAQASEDSSRALYILQLVDPHSGR